MSKDLPEKPKSDDIDIIEIFNLIGRAIKSFFDFIIKIFQEFFSILILFALFIKRNAILLSLAVILGFVIGVVSDFYQKSYYTSTMVVEPNFNTSTQLIEYIKLCSQLTRSGDTVALSQIFEISQSEASKIKAITIEAKNNNNVRLKLFNDFVKTADSTTLKNVTYEEFEDNLAISDHEQFFIAMDAKEKSVFKKVEKNILNIPLSPFIMSMRETALQNLTAQANNLEKSLEKIDSLRIDYKKIMLDEEQKLNKPAGAGTTFYMGTENLRTTNELVLFDIERQYNRALEEIALEKAQKQNYINVISGFQDIGIRMKKQNKFLFALIALGLAFLFLVLRELNTFLINQERKLKNE